MNVLFIDTSSSTLGLDFHFFMPSASSIGHGNYYTRHEFTCIIYCRRRGLIVTYIIMGSKLMNLSEGCCCYIPKQLLM